MLMPLLKYAFVHYNEDAPKGLYISLKHCLKCTSIPHHQTYVKKNKHARKLSMSRTDARVHRKSTSNIEATTCG